VIERARGVAVYRLKRLEKIQDTRESREREVCY
jgi:hypothetical protein